MTPYLSKCHEQPIFRILTLVIGSMKVSHAKGYKNILTLQKFCSVMFTESSSTNIIVMKIKYSKRKNIEIFFLAPIDS